MRVLICDQESEMLETIARTFEVDVATSKATCIDLMRANPFDVVVASERLSDGSGLELLSHVATRWPDTLRVLVIEPARLKLLRGKLAPFKLDATLKYPVDEDELETVLVRLYERLVAGAAAEEEEEEPEPPPPPPPAPSATQTMKVQKVQLPQQPARSSSSAGSGAKSTPPASTGRPAGSRSAAASPPTSGSKGTTGKAPTRPGKPSGPSLGAPRSDPMPVKRQLGNYTPLGSPEDAKMRIVEREFDHNAAPLASRAIRSREEAARPRTPSEKAKTLAAQVSNTLKRLLKR